VVSVAASPAGTSVTTTSVAAFGGWGAGFFSAAAIGFTGVGGAVSALGAADAAAGAGAATATGLVASWALSMGAVAQPGRAAAKTTNGASNDAGTRRPGTPSVNPHPRGESCRYRFS